jgi:serine/threonine-protein kinase
MTHDDAQSRTGPCPPRDDLAAFNRGELPDPDLEKLADHVSDCTDCASTLGALRAEDTAAAGLREALQGPPVTEPGFEALEARARGLVPDLSVTAVKVAVPPELPAPEAEWLPRPFGGYELLARIGRGGGGVVYLARQLGLNRLVALKHLRAGPYADPDDRARFQTEGEALARVRHPNVVQVYEVGACEGQPYLSMELVEGGSLARRLLAGPLPPREAAELVRALARAAHAMHQQGVVHRDLKPGNVLLAADGAPKLSDFGLAKLLDAEADHTVTGTVLGTVSYMAPEQAEGRSRHVTPATDVWALGAVLYECLTGRPPFKGPSREATLEQVRRQEPAPPWRWRRGLPRDLAAVCLKCLEKNPAHRYPSAEALADDLERWLAGKLTPPPTLGWPARARRALRRRPWAVAVAALGLLAALAAGATWALRDPDAAVKQIESALARGEAVTLLGETGAPRWYRWAEGSQQGRVAEAPDGAFTVHCPTALALVELVRDPRRTRFRLRAEVRHDASSDLGQVGVYFGRRALPSGGGPVHHFGALTFNDVRDEVEIFDKHFAPKFPKGVPPPPRPGGNRINLNPHLYARGATAPWEPTFTGQAKLIPPGGYFQRAGVAGGRWRPLEVVVAPDGAEAVWEGQRVAVLPASRWDANLGEFVATTRRKQPEDLYAQGLDPTYAPRGGLGLYVKRGAASFRHVAVEPLDKPD